jgi:hypothetical protein
LQSPTSFRGSVYFTIDLPRERRGGFVAETGDALAEWLSSWTQTPEQEHNVKKLLAAGADERHLFILFPSFTHAPFSVIELLMTGDRRLPTVAPSLPEGLTHIWAMSTYSIGSLFAWDAMAGWTAYPKKV